MGSPSKNDFPKYVEFLVTVLPKVAMDILVDDDKCHREKLWKAIDAQCDMLGNRAVVDGLIIDRRFDKLRSMNRMTSDTSVGPSTPASIHAGLDINRSPLTPPLSVASGRQSLHRMTHPSRRQITVLQSRQAYPLLFSESGTKDFFIGEDKLARFNESYPVWETQPELVELGGQVIKVSKAISLTWSHENEFKTTFSKFWVVSSDQIKNADVLVASVPADHAWGPRGSSLSFWHPSLACRSHNDS